MAGKKARTSLPIREAEQAANDVARQFGSFQCDACAKEIARKLGKGLDASFERLRTADNSDVIGLAREGIQVSANRSHVGVRIGDKVFDNLHHDGVPAVEWPERFITATDAPLVQQSRPIREFFGKIFLVQEFNQWLWGS
jgi:hypothetical protein